LNDPFELPSLEDIEEMERQRSQAIESLQIIDNSVKCQKCGMAVPIVGKLTARNDRIAVLQKRIKWLENYQYSNRHCLHDHHRHSGNTITSNNYDGDGGSDDDIGVVKQLKAELTDLLEEDAKADKLRSLPLYSCRITGFKFVCSTCYDKVYNRCLVQRS
jgi:hypothetical protein